MTGPADLYRYRATLVRWSADQASAWYDGDTFAADVDEGMGDHRLVHVRCAGYNSPELKGATRPAAEAAAVHARSLVEAGGMVYLDSHAFEASHEEDHFGRMLATVTLADGTDLAAAMIAGGFAVPDPAP